MEHMNEINKSTENKNNISDFYKVPDLKFDIIKLRNNLEELLAKKKF